MGASAILKESEFIASCSLRNLVWSVGVPPPRAEGPMHHSDVDGRSIGSSLSPIVNRGRLSLPGIVAHE